MKRDPVKKLLVAGLAAAAFSSAPALAADMRVKAPVHKAIDPGYNWTGWYGGVNAGVGISQTRGAVENEDAGTFNRGDAGFAGGAQAGYNWQFAPHWVAGIEADIGYLGIKRSFPELFNDFAFGVKTDWYGTARGRLGYASGPSLFYVTGGAAFVKVKNIFDTPGSSNTNDFASKSKIATGWTLGGGIETMLGGNWSAKAEYLYIDAGNQDVFEPINDILINFDNRFHVFRYGLNYRLSGQAAPAALPSHSWAGFYAGVNAGAGLSQVRATRPPSVPFATDIADSGFTGGVQAGYNWHFNPHWVAGIEGDIGWLGINHSIDTANSVLKIGVKTDWYGTIRGRLGYSTGPALLYVTGGGAFVKVKNNFDFVVAPVTFNSKSETATGWTVGGGIEAALAHNWSAKTEYLYIDAGSQDTSLVAGLLPALHFDNRFHIFRFGLNRKFGT